MKKFLLRYVLDRKIPRNILYFQFRLDPANRHKVAFKFQGKAYYWRCLPLGAAPAVFIAQKCQRFAADFYTLRTGEWVFVFIDDFLSRPALVMVDEFLERMLGYQFSPSKRVVSAVQTFCGYEIDCIRKMIRVKQSLIDDISNLSMAVLSGADPYSFQRLCGKIAFAGQVCVEGRTDDDDWLFYFVR